MAGKGGAMPGAGRKSKADELRLSAIMDDIGNTEAVLKVLYKNALDPKNVADRQLWLAYKYGKPKDNEGLPTEMIINVLRNG
jgi:hypothetical protein